VPASVARVFASKDAIPLELMLDNVEIAPVEVFLLIEVNPPSDLTAPEKVVLAL